MTPFSLKILPRFNICKNRIIAVFLRKNRLNTEVGPFNPKGRIVKPHTTLGIRIIKIITLIAEKSIVFQHNKTMSKASRYEELPFVFCAQFYRQMLTECLGFSANINCDIPNRTLYDPDQFRLGMRIRLPVKSTNYPL